MTKASDNAYPSILITEGTEPSAPAAGKQRLYIDSTTHKLKRTDSSGTDVTIEAAGSGNVATDTIFDTKGDLVAATGADAAVKVAASAYSGAYLVEDTSVSTGWKSWKRKVVYKSADESISNDTLQDDNHLLFAIGASEDWVGQFYLFVSNAAATGDFKFLFTAPSAATIIRYGVSGIGSAVTTQDATSARIQGIDSATALPVGVGALASLGYSYITGAVYVQNSTNAGNVTLQWAQNTIDGSNATIVKRGSFLIAERVA